MENYFIYIILCMNLSRIIHISRPRFWIYELWPYMIWVLGAYITINSIYIWASNDLLWWNWIVILWFAFYFLIPANILIYGVNDIYDYETDKLNPKKAQWYEALVLPIEQQSLWKRILWSIIPFICMAGLQFSWELLVLLMLHLLFCVYYSAEPIRAKARPIRDCIFSASLYVLPAIVWYIIVSWWLIWLNWWYILGWWMWCIAMQIYSAIPDINADMQAWLQTTATALWSQWSIILCMVFYAFAVILSYSVLWIISLVLWVAYLTMMIWTWVRLHDISQIYTYFPWVNMLSGMLIFLVLLYSLIYG